MKQLSLGILIGASVMAAQFYFLGGLIPQQRSLLRTSKSPPQPLQAQDQQQTETATTTTILKTEFHQEEQDNMNRTMEIIQAALPMDSRQQPSHNKTSTTSQTMTNSVPEEEKASNNQQSSTFFYPDRLYGHVHMPKTAGTTLNGEMAARYERVCGHKGYSYDFYHTNNRTTTANSFPRDGYSKLNPMYNRGRVPPWVMDEIGYHGAFGNVRF